MNGALDNSIHVLGAPRSATTLAMATEPRLIWKYGNDATSDLLRAEGVRWRKRLKEMRLRQPPHDARDVIQRVLDICCLQRRKCVEAARADGRTLAAERYTEVKLEESDEATLERVISSADRRKGPMPCARSGSAALARRKPQAARAALRRPPWKCSGSGSGSTRCSPGSVTGKPPTRPPMPWLRPVPLARVKHRRDVPRQHNWPDVRAHHRRCPFHPVQSLGRLSRTGRRRVASAMRFAEKLGLAGKIQFLGRIPNAQVLAEMQSSAVTALGSRAEPFGNVYLEALPRLLKDPPLRQRESIDHAIEQRGRAS